MNIRHAAGGSAGKARREEELRLTPLHIRQVLDGRERFEGLPAMAPGHVEEGRAPSCLVPVLVREPVAEMPHAEARGEPPGQARGEVGAPRPTRRSEEHTSELQSPCNLVCRLLLGKKKKTNTESASQSQRRSRTSL